jgi:hypothetical protein
MSPVAWLESLHERPDGYRSLLEDNGSLALAAWQLARARCRAREISTEVPTRAEVRAAARELVLRTGDGRSIPSSALLASECEARGFLVI